MGVVGELIVWYNLWKKKTLEVNEPKQITSDNRYEFILKIIEKFSENPRSFLHIFLLYIFLYMA